MDQEQETLQRWVAIEDSTGIDAALRMVKNLTVGSISLTILIVCAFYFNFHPAIVSVLSILLGWSVAERNALRSRIKLWPQLRKYLDWKLIRENAK